MEELLAPVIIPTLNRYDHLKRCIESLEKCTGVEKTKLYVGLDYPPSAKYEEGWKKVRQYLQDKCKNNRFKEIIILERNNNFGAVKNIAELETFICKEYDRFIFTEDDNEFSPNFLDYINKGLEKFEENPHVYAICGYNYPIEISQYKHNYYFSMEYSAWGCGFWTKKFKDVNRIISVDNYLEKFCKQQPISTFTKNYFRLLPFIRYVGKEFMGDAYTTTYLQTNDIYCIFPKVSLVRNWGHDGSGVNCGVIDSATSNIYETQAIQDGRQFEYDEDVERKVPVLVKNELWKLYGSTHKSKIKSLVLLLLLKLGLKG